MLSKQQRIKSFWIYLFIYFFRAVKLPLPNVLVHIFQNATRKIYEICAGSNEGIRSRSLSPTKISPFDAVRNVQRALNKRDNEIQQLEQNLRAIERLHQELNGKLIKVEESKRALEREIISMRRNIQEM